MSLPKVIYPEPHADVTLALANLNSGDRDMFPVVHSTLSSIQRCEPIICNKHSVTHEQLITSRGTIGLIDAVCGWMWAHRETALTTLWERFPRLRSYLRSRTVQYIHYKRDEAKLVGDDPWTRDRVCALEQQMLMLPDDH